MKSISAIIIGFTFFCSWLTTNSAQSQKYMIHGLSFVSAPVKYEIETQNNRVEIEVLRSEISAKILEIYSLI
jgi:hypothetical protein